MDAWKAVIRGDASPPPHTHTPHSPHSRTQTRVLSRKSQTVHSSRAQQFRQIRRRHRKHMRSTSNKESERRGCTASPTVHNTSSPVSIAPLLPQCGDGRTHGSPRIFDGGARSGKVNEKKKQPLHNLHAAVKGSYTRDTGWAGRCARLAPPEWYAMMRAVSSRLPLLLRFFSFRLAPFSFCVVARQLPRWPVAPVVPPQARVAVCICTSAH